MSKGWLKSQTFQREFWVRAALCLITVACALLVMFSTGCKDAKKLVKESKEGYQVIREVATNVADLTASLRTNDFAGARELAAKADALLHTRVLAWCVEILAVEEREGVVAAKEKIKQLKKTEAITADELVALGEIEKFFDQKGRERTGDLVVLIGALVAEQKFGHGAGGLVLITRETYRSSQVYSAWALTNAPGTNQLTN